MIGASILFAVMSIATRSAASQMSASQIVAIRFAIMAMGVLLLLAVGRASIRPKNLKLLGLRGVLGGSAVLLYFIALATARDAGTASLLQYSSPIFTNLFGWLALSERPSPRLAVGGALALVGVVLVLWTPGGLELGMGELAAIASAVIAGAAVVTIRASRAHDDATTILFAFSIGGLLLSLPFAIPTWQQADPAIWGLAFVVGLSSFVAQLMMTHAFGLVTAGHGALFQLLTPVFTFAMGALWLSEPISLLAAAGGALTVGAIGWAAVPPKRPTIGASSK